MTVPSLHTVLRVIRGVAGEAGCDERTDRQLLGCFTTQRDEKAFAELVHRHGQLVWGVCWRVLRHHQDVEDAFQGTFLVLARKASSVRWRASVGGWLHEVASRVAAELRTRRARHEYQPLRASTVLEEEAQEETWRCCCETLDEELRRLPDRHRLPLVLCYLEGQTRDQVAQQLGWSLRTLDRRLEQGRELLRQRLVRRGLSMSVGLLAAMRGERASAELAPALLRNTVQLAGQRPAPVTPVVGKPGQAISAFARWWP